MTLKIPKTAAIFIAVVFLLVAAFWLGGKSSEKTSPATSSSLASPSSFKKEGRKPKEGEIREIAVVAKQFEFNPNPIRVKLGEKVRLKITSVDVTHGFSLPDFGIDETLEPGKEVIVEFQATKRGEFSFFCSIPCGVGHASMRGRLIVE